MDDTHDVLVVDPHGHALKEAGHHGAHGPEAPAPDTEKSVKDSAASHADLELADHYRVQALYSSSASQIIGVAILEFGVIFHSFLIGLTLAVDEDFKVLFVVLVFHRE